MAELNRNLQPRQFYHATITPYQPGDTITSPSSRGVAPPRRGDSSPDHSYFTSDLQRAGTYTHSLHAGSAIGDRRVYQVEPSGSYEPDPNHLTTDLSGDRDQFRSAAPLRVTSNVTTPDLVMRAEEKHPPGNDPDFNVDL